MGYSFQPLLTRAEVNNDYQVNSLSHTLQVNKTAVTHYFSIAKTQQDLGYVPLERNMDGVVKWYKDRLPKQQKKSQNTWIMIIINILLMFVFIAVLFNFIPLAG